MFLSTILLALAARGEQHTVAPFELINNKIVVQVEISGQPYRFLLDTGGGMEVSPRVQAALGLSPIGEATVTGVNRLSVDRDIVALPPVTIGELTLPEVPALVSDLYDQPPIRCYGLDGMLGRDTLTGLALQLDLRAGQLVLTDQPARLGVDPARQVPLILREDEDNMPYVSATLDDGITVEACIDTGSGKLFSPKTDLVEALLDEGRLSPERVHTLQSNTNIGASGRQARISEAYQLELSSLSLGSLPLPPLRTDPSARSRTRFGAGLLVHGRVTLDTINQTFAFEPYEEPISPRLPLPHGFEWRPRDQEMVVTAVVQEGPAARAGLRHGDVLLSVNGTPYESLGESAVCRAYLAPPPWANAETLVMHIRRGRREKQLIVHRSPLR